MPDISVQFYATPKELFSFVKEAIDEFKLHAVAMQFRPFEARKVDQSFLDLCFSESSKFDRLYFTVMAPKFPIENEIDQANKNPDFLRLQIGKYKPESLEQSWLSCRTENKAVYDIWKKIANKLKKLTSQGVTSINRQTGVSAFYKSFRYTEGAKLLEQAGVIMLPPQGPNGPKIILGHTDMTP